MEKIKNRDNKGRFLKGHKINLKYCDYPKRREKYLRKYNKKYRKDNLEYFKEYGKNWREKNNELVKQYDKEYIKNNPEIIRKIRKRGYQKNKEKRLKVMKKWRDENKEKKKEINKGYYKNNEERLKEDSQKRRNKFKLEENKRRRELGLPLVGEGFKKEMELLVYIHKLFLNYDVITHHRSWGGGRLELDIYIPKLKLAFEYMGSQHYEYNKFLYNNKEEFEEQQYRDRCKKRLCKMKGINLIRIKFDEKLSEQLILSKLKHTTIKTNQGNLNKLVLWRN